MGAVGELGDDPPPPDGDPPPPPEGGMGAAVGVGMGVGTGVGVGDGVGVGLPVGVGVGVGVGAARVVTVKSEVWLFWPVLLAAVTAKWYRVLGTRLDSRKEWLMDRESWGELMP